MFDGERDEQTQMQHTMHRVYVYACIVCMSALLAGHLTLACSAYARLSVKRHKCIASLTENFKESFKHVFPCFEMHYFEPPWNHSESRQQKTRTKYFTTRTRLMYSEYTHIHLQAYRNRLYSNIRWTHKGTMKCIVCLFICIVWVDCVVYAVERIRMKQSVVFEC